MGGSGREVTGAYAAAVVLACTCLVGLLACSGGDDVPAPRALGRITGGSTVQVLAVVEAGRSTLATGSLAGHPAAWSSPDGGRHWSLLERGPGDYYGERAPLVQVASSGARMVALGVTSGGAHGLPRYGLWSGPVGGPLTQQPLDFELFGGEHAISVGQLTGWSGGFAIAGTWQRAGDPIGVALWLSADGTSWTRRDDDRLLLPGKASLGIAAARSTNGLVAAGTGPAPAGTGQRATFWPVDSRGVVAAGQAAGEGSPVRLACRSKACVAVGTTVRHGDLRYASWWSSGGGWRQASHGPGGSAAGGGIRSVTLATDGSAYAVVGPATGGRVYRGTAGGWRAVPLPPGATRPVVGADLLVVAQPDGARVYALQ